MSDNITAEIKKLAHDIKKDNDEAIASAKAGAIARAEELKQQADRQIEALAEKQTKLEAIIAKQSRAQQQNHDSELSEKALHHFNVAHKSFNADFTQVSADTYAEYKKHFHSFLRKDKTNFSAIEQKAMQAGVLTDGGFTIPQELDSKIVRLSREYSKFRSLATEKTISTDRYEILVQTGGAAAGWVTETAARPVTGTPTINKITILLGEIYANPAVTQWYLDDPLLDAEEFIAGEVAIAFAKLEDAAFINGAAGGPQGILTYADGTAFNQVQHINAGAATFASGATQIDGLLEMIYGAARLPDEFEPSAEWLMNKATMLQIMKLKDSTNQYLWDIDKTDHYKMMLLGKAVNYSPDMPVAAANAKAVVLADFKRAYTVLNKNGTRILRDPYTNMPFVSFYTTRRCGGGLANTQAIRILQMV